jgi:hypothetical protein
MIDIAQLQTDVQIWLTATFGFLALLGLRAVAA